MDFRTFCVKIIKFEKKEIHEKWGNGLSQNKAGNND
jgi:hypothetical protein